MLNYAIEEDCNYEVLIKKVTDIFCDLQSQKDDNDWQQLGEKLQQVVNKYRPKVQNLKINKFIAQRNPYMIDFYDGLGELENVLLQQN